MIFEALKNIKLQSNTTMCDKEDGIANRMNIMGDKLEKFVEIAFVGLEPTNKDYLKRRSEVFSYLGNSNNPPDLMLRGGEAIEVKKKKTLGGTLALNSSFPKDKLHSTDSRIKKECVDSEEWSTKEMVYVIGTTADNKNLDNLLFIYGSLFCASKEVYEDLFNNIKDGINSIEGIEFIQTKELGKIKKIDNLNFTDLRIRGMWNIVNPNNGLTGVSFKHTDKVNIGALIPEELCRNEEFNRFEDFCRNNEIDILDVQVPNPNNPSKLINCKKVEYEI